MGVMKKIRAFFSESSAKKALKKYDPEFFSNEQKKEIHKDNKFTQINDKHKNK